MSTPSVASKYIPGYMGHIPGAKWRFGTADGRMESTSRPKSAKAPSGSQSLTDLRTIGQSQSSLMPPAIFRRAPSIEIIGNRNSATQIPVRTSDDFSQTDAATAATNAGNAMAPNSNSVSGVSWQNPLTKQPEQNVQHSLGAPAPTSTPVPKRQLPMDGRIVNHHRPDVMFMRQNPFSGLDGWWQRNNEAARRQGRYWDSLSSTSASRSSSHRYGYGYGGYTPTAVSQKYGVPASGYTGYIPGLSSMPPGRQFVEMVKALQLPANPAAQAAN